MVESSELVGLVFCSLEGLVFFLRFWGVMGVYSELNLNYPVCARVITHESSDYS